MVSRSPLTPSNSRSVMESKSLPLKQDPAGRYLAPFSQKSHDRQGCDAFAAARLPYNTDYLPRIHMESHVVHTDILPPVTGKFNFQICDFKDM